MKKIGGIGVALIVFFASLGLAKATCDTTEMNRLRSLASNVKTSYKEVFEPMEDGTFTPPDGLTDEMIEDYVAYRTLFEVYITNLTEDLYIEVKDTISGKTTKYTYKDSNNGTITIKNYNIEVINKYTISIYTTNTDCSNSKIRTIEMKTPRFNNYSALDYCQNNKEYYMCHMYVDYDLPPMEDFVKKINKYITDKEKKQQQEEEDKKNQGFIEFLRENKTTIIIVASVIVVAGVGATVVIIRRRRRVV